jgi:signal transduction histidine kinase
VPRPTLRWHESWIVRVAAMGGVVMLVAFGAAAYLTRENVDAMARLAHDAEIEDALAAHLERIRNVQELRQALVVERLLRLAPAAALAQADEAKLRALLAAAGVETLAPPAALRVAAAGGPPSGPAVAWLDKDHLRVHRWVVELPRGELYDAFKRADEVKRRYQLVGAELEDRIRPTFLRAFATVLVVAFALFASLFFLSAQRLRARIFEVLEGFTAWSERDTGFRFDDGGRYRGELKLITLQFNAMADEVEANRQRSLYLEKIASWQIIARKLAHEIKNPLTPIQMMVSQLRRRYKGDDPAFTKLLDEAQHIITEEVAGLRRMVDNFSNFARLPEPDPRPSDLAQLVRHVVELERVAFPEHEVRARGLDAGGKVMADVDEDLMRQVLINLVKNAAEASSGRTAHIEVGVEVERHAALLTVRDDGPGVPKENQKRVFEAYFTTKHTGPSPGMGLGLAVCQKIVLEHGGKLQLASRPGETVFTIRLPRLRSGQGERKA